MLDALIGVTKTPGVPRRAPPAPPTPCVSRFFGAPFRPKSAPKFDPKIDRFSNPIWDPKWPPNGPPKWPPRRPPRRPKSVPERGPFSDAVLEPQGVDFGIDFGPHFEAFPSISPSILDGLPASSSVRWRLGARSALDNPASSPGDRWFRPCVSVHIPPTPTSNPSYCIGLALLLPAPLGSGRGCRAAS